jgi:hypothetical protein
MGMTINLRLSGKNNAEQSPPFGFGARLSVVTLSPRMGLAL